MNVYVIMGEGNTRKSSLVRCLTGIHEKSKEKKPHIVATQEGDIPVKIRIGSLQEVKKLPAEFIAECKLHDVPNILCAVRIEPEKSCPSGVEYLNAFIKEGWEVKPVIALDTISIPDFPKDLEQPMYLYGSKSTPTNAMAARVRELWGWI